MTNWTECRIGDEVGVAQGLCMNSKSKHLLAETGYPLLRITDLINKTAEQFINENKVQKKFISKSDDLIYTRTGQVGLIFKGRVGVVHNNCFRVLPSEKINKHYLYWFLKTNYAYDFANSVATGAAQPDLGHDSFKSMPFRYPTIQNQNKIAAILSAYDDLIENNQVRIKLLESMAEEIYREWFVRLRFPNYENERFEKGLPATWDIKPVKDIVDRKKFGRLYYEHELSEHGRVIVIDQSRNAYLGFYDGEPQHKATSNDPIILFGDHSCKMVLMTKPFSLAENVIPFKPKQKISTYFLYHLVKDLTRTTEYKRHWTDLTIKKVLVPSEKLQFEFEKLVKPNHEQIELLRSSISKLQKIRDALLPRLISGKLSVESLDIKFPPSMEVERQS